MKYTQLQQQARRLLYAALQTYGARRCKLLRQSVDANSVPTGEPQLVGCLLGVTYRERASGAMHIDLPGIALTTSPKLSFCGLLTMGRVAPAVGDSLQTHDGTHQVLRVTVHADVLYELTLAED